MGREIVSVPGRRFRTKIQLGANGFSWGTGSQAIDFIVCAKSAVYHVVKYDKIRVFDPKIVQDFDGYKVNVRIYHDCFVPDNKRVAIYAHLSNEAAKEPTVKFIYDDTAKKLSSVAVIPGDLLIDGLYVKTTSAPAIGTNVVAGTPGEGVSEDLYIGTNCFEVGAYANLKTVFNITAGTYYLFAVKDGKVVATNATDTIVIS